MRQLPGDALEFDPDAGFDAVLVVARLTNLRVVIREHSDTFGEGHVRPDADERFLERVGDHAKNISEHAVYAAAAEDFRHLRETE